MFDLLIAIVFVCCPTVFQLLGMTTTAYAAFIITMVFGAIVFGHALLYFFLARRDEWARGKIVGIVQGVITLLIIGLGVFLAIKTGIV